MKFISTLSLIMILVLNSGFSFGQGRVDGFYKGKGNIELAFGGGVEFASKYFAGNDKIGLSRKIYNSSLTVSTGLFDRLDLYIHIPYVAIGDQNSIQDGSLFLKYLIRKIELSQGELSLSLAGGFSSNLADYQTEGINAIGQKAKVLDIRPIVHYQIGAWFATAQFAYNYKFDPVPNATNASVKVGKATGKYYFDIWYENLYTFGGFDYKGTPAPPSFRELGVSYHKIGGTFYKPLGQRLGGYVSSAYVLSGRNIGQGPILNIGLVLKNM
ncbi:hypothetical protein [Brumimicrobium mesophilum]|uniref:hypothetical protein n=1 Tax=Brumimicrobium mesophilum TaxID=392717 RepID=UPI000D142B82|nr:hypothetical protein [Brumimicrobium mesophilum]